MGAPRPWRAGTSRTTSPARGGPGPARSCHVRATHTCSSRIRPPGGGGPRRPVRPSATGRPATELAARTATTATRPPNGSDMRCRAGVETHIVPSMADVPDMCSAPGCRAIAEVADITTAGSVEVIAAESWPSGIGAAAGIAPWQPSEAVAGEPCMRNRPSRTAQSASSRAMPRLRACPVPATTGSLPRHLGRACVTQPPPQYPRPVSDARDGKLLRPIRIPGMNIMIPVTRLPTTVPQIRQLKSVRWGQRAYVVLGAVASPRSGYGSDEDNGAVLSRPPVWPPGASWRAVGQVCPANWS
ncbi:hypothetical protein QF030_000238 [Streptomyces rishiriensis]|uniref:Uncharacterized protein n=1 Tax=Streptomyces rishiriensis TaxID=68264 RepID=A0ABU0NG31_STRRH|nr:hypothetical protein [Streptomyces rishiriensis]